MDCKPYLRAHADELIESLAALIRIPSVEGTPEDGAPYGREVARCLGKRSRCVKGWASAPAIWITGSAGANTARAKR